MAHTKLVSSIAISAAAAAMLTITGCGGGGGGGAAAPTVTADVVQQPANIISTATAAAAVAVGAGADTTALAWVAANEADLDVLGDSPIVELAGDIAADTTLDSANHYAINGTVTVKDGVTLTIPAGTLLYGKTGQSYLAVEQGGMLDVQGTAVAPVIFTSEQDLNKTVASAGAAEWGGVSIFGYANTNAGLVNYEAGNFQFGCDDATVACNDADNSGSLQYMVIKNSGYEVEVDAELNGLSLGGVGSATTIDNVAVIGSKDDGIEIWGGTVGLTNVKIMNAQDDSFDLDLGWTGSVDNIWIVQGAVKADHGIEADNNGNNMSATPITDPAISNITIEGSAVGDDAIKLREGMGGDFNDALIISANPAQSALQINDQATFDNAAFSFTNTTLVSTNNFFFAGDDINATKAHIDADATNVTADIKDIATMGADTTAFDWIATSGADANHDAAIVGLTEVELSGTLANMTLNPLTSYYALNGTVIVPDGVTLTIPAGTILYGKTGQSYLAVEQGGTLNVAGTAAEPVIMTSAADLNGSATVDTVAQWGGVSIFGKAATNAGIVNYEAGNFTFGCDDSTVTCDAADNSGSLQYMVIKHSGYEVEVDAELNGLSLGGVGSATTVDNVVVIGSKDDGIEIWGGTVDLTNVKIMNAQDDSFDLDLGWTGSVDNIWIVQGAVKADHGIESDNNGNNMSATPITDPTISNMTIDGSAVADDAIKMREGMGGDFNNVVVNLANATQTAIQVNDQATFDNAAFSFTDTVLVSPAASVVASEGDFFSGDDVNELVTRFSTAGNGTVYGVK